MKTQTVKSDGLLLLTAIIWGFAFVAQRIGMEYIGPFTFNGIRFALGGISIVPLMVLSRKQHLLRINHKSIQTKGDVIKAGIIAGGILFIGSSLQQIGIVYTTAGKAGFITGLYVIIVPMIGLIWKQTPEAGTWVGAILAVIGLYFLSMTEQLTISYGDFLVLIGSFFWAGHVLILGWFSPRMNAFELSFIQYITCSILSLITALFTESITFQALRCASAAILYGGILSVGVAYTLQVIAQREAPPSHAAILLSLETVFAAVGGWIILDETLSSRGILGCVLMFSGMMISQLHGIYLRRKKESITY